MPFMKLTMVGLAVLLLSACASTAPDAARGAGFDGKGGMGILAGSVSSDDADNFFTQDSNLYFTSLTDPKAPVAHLTINDHCKGEKPDFTQPCGKVFAFILKAGQYRLDSWYVSAQNGGVLIKPQQWEGPTITVQPGKVTYIGNIHMVYDNAIPGAGLDGWRAWPHVTDQHERDMPILLQKVPPLKPGDVTTAVVELPPPSQMCTWQAGVFHLPPHIVCSDHD
jgi:hypothetical protein